MTLDRVRTEIRQACPALVIEQIAFLGAGVDSDAYLLNGAWVFRFPKHVAASASLAREIALLPQLAPSLPVAVPHFKHIGQQTGSGRLFVGYRLIPGEPLAPALFEALPAATQDDILRTLAEFLRAVHAFPLENAQAAGVGTLSTHELVRETWEQARGLALARLSTADGAALTSLIEQFLADGANFAGPSHLLYADFAPEHILYDQASQRIAGIIDWGDLAIGDPDYDLTYLYQDYGAPFVQRLLTYLPHPDPARLLAKLGVFSATDYLHDLAQAQADTTVDDLTETLDGLRDVLTGPD